MLNADGPVMLSVQGSANLSEGSGSNKGYKGSQGRPPATEIRVPGGVTAAAVSPDGACIATAGVDGVMRIYSMSGGGPTAGFKVPLPFEWQGSMILTTTATSSPELTSACHNFTFLHRS